MAHRTKSDFGHFRCALSNVYCILFTFCFCTVALAIFGGNVGGLASDKCAVRVGGCKWFPCGDIHKDAECIHGDCFCVEGYCAPNGFECKNVSMMNTSACGNGTDDSECLSFSTKTNRILTYSPNNHTVGLAQEKLILLEVNGFPILYNGWRAVYSACVVCLFMSVIWCSARSIAKSFIKNGWKIEKHFFDSILRNPKQHESTSDWDPRLVLWFLIGETLFCGTGLWVWHQDTCAADCTPSNQWLAVLGIACVMLSGIRWEPYLPGYGFAGTGSVKERADGLLARNRLIEEDRPSHWWSEGEVPTLVQMFLRFMGYDLLVLYGAPRRFYFTMFLLGVEVTHRGIFYSLFLVQSDMWARRLKAILNAIDADEHFTDEEIQSMDRQSDKYTSLMESKANTSDDQWKAKTPHDQCYRLTIQPSNLYIDLKAPFATKVFVVFLGQVILSAGYFVGLRDDTSELLCDEDNSLWANMRSFTMFGATVIMQLILSTQIGSSFYQEIFDWFLIYSAGTANIEVVPNSSDDIAALELNAFNAETLRVRKVQAFAKKLNDLPSNAERNDLSIHDEAKAAGLDGNWIIKGQINSKIPGFCCKEGRISIVPDRHTDQKTEPLLPDHRAGKEVEFLRKKASSMQDLYSPHLKTRAIFSFFINHILLSIIVQTAPLTLIGDGDPMDYVKDCLAIGFIVMLDDVKDSDGMLVYLGKHFRNRVKDEPRVASV